MNKYKLTRKAVEDLNEIWNYTFENWSEGQADRYYFILLDAFGAISQNPGIGKPYDQVAENLLGFKVSRHIIFYRITTGKSVEIVRILHGRMDIKSGLQ